MAKTSFIQIPAGQEELFYKGLAPGDRFTFARIKRKPIFSSRKQKKGMSQKTLMPQVAEVWAALSTADKELWNSAAENMGMNGWKLFLQDKCARIVNGIAGNATPSNLHQSWVGKMGIVNPADDLVIAQYHPNTYWTSRKVRGYDRREPVRVTELITIPLTIGISYKSNLVASGGGDPVARFYADVVSLYQGRQIHNELEIPFALVSDWTRAEATLRQVLGQVNSYVLYLQLQNVRGTLMFDNVKSYHTGQNWARDPFCNDISQTFTRVYFQVPKHWAAVDMPAGSYYDSVYPTD